MFMDKWNGSQQNKNEELWLVGTSPSQETYQGLPARSKGRANEKRLHRRTNGAFIIIIHV